jgi:hypothetical protein
MTFAMAFVRVIRPGDVTSRDNGCFRQQLDTTHDDKKSLDEAIPGLA